MMHRSSISYAEITMLIRACYSEFNSYRIPRVAMQDITDTHQLVKHDTTQAGDGSLKSITL